MNEVSNRRQNVRISDVARAAGVSKTLVSYALNDRPGVKESTRAHIVETAQTLGWTPSMQARALSASRAYAIGLILRRSAGPADYWIGLMAGIRGVLSASQYILVTEVVEDAEGEADAFRRLVRDGRVDGIVTSGPIVDDLPCVRAPMAGGDPVADGRAIAITLLAGNDQMRERVAAERDDHRIDR